MPHNGLDIGWFYRFESCPDFKCDCICCFLNKGMPSVKIEYVETITTI